MKLNRNFGKLENGTLTYAPAILRVVTHHHDEWDEPVIDPETGEPTGETEHKSRDYDTWETKMWPTADDYAKMGWLRVVDEMPDEPPQDGYHWEAAGWKQWLGILKRVYEQVVNPPAPPRVFSKINLETAVFKRGLLAKLDAFVDTQTITNEFGDIMPLRRAYNTAQTFREDHPLFAPYLEAAKSALGVDDETAEAILAECVIGY